MYITVDDIKNEISLDYPINNKNGNKKVGLICAYFVYSFYNVEKDEKIHLKNGETLPVKRGCYTKKDIEKVSSGNKTNDLILNLTPENVTQHSRIVTTTHKGSSTPTKMSKIIGRQIH